MRRSEAEVSRLRRAGGRDADPPHPRCSSVGGDAHAVERSGTSTLGVHRPAVFASYSGRTEPPAPTHVLMCRVSVPCLSLWERWPSAARTERENNDHTSPLSHLRWQLSQRESQGSVPRYIGAYRGGVRPSAPTTVYRTCALSLPCHSEPVTDVTGVGIRPPPFSCLRRGTFALGGKSTQKRRSNLRFENPFARLHPPRILTAFATRTLCPANFT